MKFESGTETDQNKNLPMPPVSCGMLTYTFDRPPLTSQQVWYQLDTIFVQDKLAWLECHTRERHLQT